MTSKQRAYLRSLAMTMTPIVNIGKNGVTDSVTSEVDNLLECKELIKISVLKNCLDNPKELAETIAGRTRSQVVQVIGKKIVLFRVSKKKPVIILPK